jgi:hypothetical protein
MVVNKGKGAKTVATKNKSATAKSPSAQKISGGPKGGMHNFEGVGAQKPGVSSVSKGSTGGKFAKAGPSGKMQKFTPVKPQKPGVSSVTNTGSKSYAK